jgi:ATP-binding cassette subfamily B protein
VVAETAVLRGAGEPDRMVRAITLGLALACVLALVEGGLAWRVLTLGRRLEGGLRRLLGATPAAAAGPLPALQAVVGHAGRAHMMHELRNLPLLLGQAGSAAVELLVLALVLVLLHPPAAPLVLAVHGARRARRCRRAAPLREREMRHREHSAALANLELDAVLAVHPVRSLGGAEGLAREHEDRLQQWRAAALASGRTRTAAAVVQGGVGAVLAVAIVLTGLPHVEGLAAQLLLVLFALSLPLVGERLAVLAQQWPGLRTLTMRLVEPLDAPPEDGAGSATGSPGPAGGPAARVGRGRGGRTGRCCRTSTSSCARASTSPSSVLPRAREVDADVPCCSACSTRPAAGSSSTGRL